MQKKRFDKAQLQTMVAAHRPHLSRTTDRLRHALIGHRLIELYGGTVTLGWWLPFEKFIDQAPPPWHQHVAPVCVFTPDANGNWTAAAVICCSASTVPSNPTARQTVEFLRRADIEYVAVTADDVDRGHHKSDEFEVILRSAVRPAAEAATPTTNEEEEFLSAPRPMYPPRSRLVRD